MDTLSKHVDIFESQVSHYGTRDVLLRNVIRQKNHEHELMILYIAIYYLLCKNEQELRAHINLFIFTLKRLT